ncbi:MAG: DUF1016 N-terminal domain-containing protein [Bacilli bacterium]
MLYHEGKKTLFLIANKNTEIEIGQTPSAQIPWSHNLEILRVESKEQRHWYILLSKEKEFNRKVIKCG